MIDPNDWPSWQPVADQVRRLTTTILDGRMSAADVAQAASLLAEVNDFVAARAGEEPPLEHTFASQRPLRDGAHRFRRRSIVASPEHPMAPPLSFTVTDEGTAVGRGTLGRAQQGHLPGFCDDSYLGLLFDNLFGVTASWALPRPFFTKTLSVTRRAQVPLGVPIDVHTRVDRVEGRKAFLEGEITWEGGVCARGSALMVMPKETLD